MWFVWDNKGWVLLLTAIILAGIGGGIHFGLGIGFMMSATGFLFAAFVSAIASNS